jgi:hypothetical protein
MSDFLDVIHVIGFILIILAGIVMVGYRIAYATTGSELTIAVQEKWVKYHGDDAKYLVSDVQGEVFQITDSWLYWRWNSSDLYAKLQPGMICKVETQGWRLGFMSDYRNIITADCSGGK